MSKIEDKVCEKILERAKVGKSKYGTTMERTDLSRLEWLIHAQEEAMDLTVYLEKLIEEEEFVQNVTRKVKKRKTDRNWDYGWNQSDTINDKEGN